MSSVLVTVSVTFHLMFVQISFSSFWVAEWPPYGKELLTRLIFCSHCILTICNFSFPRFDFQGGNWVLIAAVAGHCLLVTFNAPFMSS